MYAGGTNPGIAKVSFPFDSGHSKNVKRGVAIIALTSTLKKTCEHQDERSFRTLISRLQMSGYPNTLLVAIHEKIWIIIKQGFETNDGDTNKKARRL